MKKLIVLIALALGVFGLFGQTKDEKRAAKQSAQQAAMDAQYKADHVSTSLPQLSGGCVVVDTITYHRDVLRGQDPAQGTLFGARIIVLGITQTIIGVIHNNCGKPIVADVYAKFYGVSGESIDHSNVEVLVDSAISTFAVPGCSMNIQWTAGQHLYAGGNVGGCDTVYGTPPETGKIVMSFEAKYI